MPPRRASPSPRRSRRVQTMRVGSAAFLHESKRSGLFHTRGVGGFNAAVGCRGQAPGALFYLIGNSMFRPLSDMASRLLPLEALTLLSAVDAEAGVASLSHVRGYDELFESWAPRSPARSQEKWRAILAPAPRTTLAILGTTPRPIDAPPHLRRANFFGRSGNDPERPRVVHTCRRLAPAHTSADAWRTCSPAAASRSRS